MSIHWTHTLSPSTCRCQASFALFLSCKNLAQRAQYWPCGLMDKALLFGSKDCRFESCQGQDFLKSKNTLTLANRSANANAHDMPTIKTIKRYKNYQKPPKTIKNHYQNQKKYRKASEAITTIIKNHQNPLPRREKRREKRKVRRRRPKKEKKTTKKGKKTKLASAASTSLAGEAPRQRDRGG